MKTGSLLRGLALFFVSAAWFAVVIPWTGFLDPDAFYHAKASLLVWQHGPLLSFPWLDLTLLGTHFADLHFLFHIFVAPFTAAFGMFDGIRVATVILSALFVLVFAACLKWLRVRWAYLWAGMLLLSYGLDMRLLLGKASPLALIWFIFGIAAAWKRRPWLAAFAAAGFALSHGGWPYLAGSVVLLWIGDALYSKIVMDKPLLQAAKDSLWLESVMAFVGGSVGLFLHPNYPGIVRMAWTQIVTIGLGTPFQHVNLGVEWLPSDLISFLVTLSPFIIIGLLGMAGLLFAAEKPLDHGKARLLVSLNWILAAFVAMTLKSQRNVEYLIPIVTFWCAALWSLVDAGRFRKITRSMPRWLRIVAPASVAICLAFAFGKQVWSLWSAMRSPQYPDSVYAQAMSAISGRATSGERIFHTSWDEFPMLFAADDRLRYVSGLDPTFLYVASSTLSDAVRDVTLVAASTTKEDVWALVHDRLRSRFIFVSKKNHAKFLDLMRKDTRFVQIADQPDSAAFMIAPPPGVLENPLLTKSGG